MSQFAEEMKNRTKKFAISIIRLSRTFPKNEEAIIIKRQIIRSATAVAANYRAVCRARSDKEFTSKLGTVIEETDETAFWLEVITETDILSEKETKEHVQEAYEILRIVSKSRTTMKERISK